jgi:hypothetical protein
MINPIIQKLALALLAVTFNVSCSIKGMYVSSNGGGPMPLNMSLMKKSDRDVQAVKTKDYEYYAETINGDETIVPQVGITAWKWVKILGDLFNSATIINKDNVGLEAVKSNNATSLGIKDLEVKEAVETFVAPE